MRGMNLPKLSVSANSLEQCVELYLERLSTDDFIRPDVSLLLTAYMAWPNEEAERDSFVATCQARSIIADTDNGDGSAPKVAASGEPILVEKFGGLRAIANTAFDYLSGKIAHMQQRWLLVADIFQTIVDMAHEDSIVLRRGSSISKAIDLCELERGLPGHSQLRNAWSDFRDVAHLLTASASLAHKGLAHSASAHQASILNAIWVAPDAVLALAAGLQDFGLQPKSIRGEAPILRPEMVWRIPAHVVPEKPFIVFRRLTQAQLDFLSARRVSKKYIPASRTV